MAFWDGVHTLVVILISILLLHLLLHIRGSLVSGGKDHSPVAVDEESTVRLDHSMKCESLRADGWASTFYVCLLVAGSFCVFPGLFVLLMYPTDPEVFLKVFVINALDTGGSLLSMALQFFLNCKWFKMDMDDLSMIRRRRDTWLDGLELQALINKYGEKPTKIMDAVNRRFGHFAHYSIHVGVFACGNKTQRCMLQTFFYLAIFRSLLHVALETNDCLGVVDCSFARMRDGCLGRFNLVVVAFWGGFGEVFLVLVLIFHTGSTDMSFHVFQLCGILATQGVIWGDTAGELVGSFCGRLEFNVYGFGETNRKTVEGTLAVWLATFVSSLCVVSAAEDVLSFSGYAMFFMSTIAKFMEIASPRGTNSFFLARLLIPIRRK